ncbi:hypothetical protein Dsin_017391 [Dipteronia sinensis]|uniref:Non-haem dioxygenase N-terminal domain-containing protein n=1 Tax=Dipteronia sinensis TaxID=43782 RepID=A0AAE0AEZ3_9ROSI|nr:hypothetical protein Dsin_017391 [Dipteronia sinensis]
MCSVLSAMKNSVNYAMDIHGALKSRENRCQKRKPMCSQVREALDNHGCFILFYDKRLMTLREEMFNIMKDLFDLSEETKNKYVNPRPYQSYSGANNPLLPLQEIKIRLNPLQTSCGLRETLLSG